MRRNPMMIHAGMATTAAATALASPCRQIYTTWGSVPCEEWAGKESWLRRITNKSAYKSFEFFHVPVVEKPQFEMNAVETYLLSCIEDDIQRLTHIAWGYDFDPYWHDRVNSHSMLYSIIYEDKFPVYKFIFGDCSHKEAERKCIEQRLNYLKSVLHWAAMTERRFTAITKVRYHMQREVWNALERERALASCTEIVEAFERRVPEEFKAKAMSELNVHLTNMRHWVCDLPNVKSTFTRRMA